jgi:hypothetical protein
MRNSLMDRAPGNQVDAIMTHPQHQWALNTMIGLIRDLRQSATVGDLYLFQDRLLPLIIGADERRGQVRRVIKRLRDRPGKLPSGAPELGTGLDPLDIETWKLEEEVFERVARQLRSIGDALAWRAFGYERRIIVALSRGESAGPMNRKAGVTAEREFIKNRWESDGEFVLHHDLTNVLRIGDATIFHKDGGATLHEVKTSGKAKVPRQNALRLGTQHALAEGSALPSGYNLLESRIPYRTDLAGLRNVVDLAHQRTGIQGGVVSSGRAVIAANQFTAVNHYTGDGFGDRVIAEYERYRRKIGASAPKPVLGMWSLDLVAKSVARPPWAIYPLPAQVAASLIADAIFFCVLMSPDAISAALAKAGVATQWLQPLDGPVDLDEPLLAVAATTRLVDATRFTWSSLNPEAIFCLMLELVDLSTWSRQVAWSLGQDVDRGIRPWPLFMDEGKTWA